MSDDAVNRRLSVELMNESVRPYSKDISEAWRVIEKLRKVFPDSDVTVASVVTQHDEYRWMCTVSGVASAIGDPYSENPAADSICQTALKSMKMKDVIR